MLRVDNKTFNSLNPTYNACVGDNGGFYMHAYVKGYREAVEIYSGRTLRVYSKGVANDWAEIFTQYLQVIFICVIFLGFAYNPLKI